MFDHEERNEMVSQDAYDKLNKVIEYLRKKIGKWEKGLNHPGAAQIIRGEMRREAVA